MEAVQEGVEELSWDEERDEWNDCSNGMMAATLATLLIKNVFVKSFRQHLVTCEALLQQARVKIPPESSQVLRVELGVVLGVVAVMVVVVAKGVDAVVEVEMAVK